MISRVLTFVAYGAICVAVFGFQAMTMNRGSLTLGRLTSGLMHNRWVRMMFLLGWVWLGWHLFARGSASFLH